MKVKTGDKDLLESETFLTLGLGETVIELDEVPELLRFILTFVNDEGEKQAAVKWEPIPDANTLRITLTNWNSPLGTTLVEPVEIGTYRNRRLFMLFNITKAGSKGQLREVTFSLYLGEAVQDGHN